MKKLTHEDAYQQIYQHNVRRSIGAQPSASLRTLNPRERWLVKLGRWLLLTVVAPKGVISIGRSESAVISDVDPIGVLPLLRVPFDSACGAYTPSPSAPKGFFKFLAPMVSLYVAVIPADFFVVQIRTSDRPRQNGGYQKA
jgi:hypothetical protein